MISGCRHAAYPAHAHRLDLSSPPLVKALGLSRYLEIRTIRFALEGLAAEQVAAHASAGEIERPAEIQRRFEAARNSRDAALANRLIGIFTSGYRLCAMDILIAQIEACGLRRARSSRSITRMFRRIIIIADEHIHLMAALESRNGAAARRAIEQDILRRRGGRCLSQEIGGLLSPAGMTVRPLSLHLRPGKGTAGLEREGHSTISRPALGHERPPIRGQPSIRILRPGAGQLDDAPPDEP